MTESDSALDHAAGCLRSIGATILDRRWREPGTQDEAPIIASHQHSLVICDVRSIAPGSSTDLTHMNPAKVRRLRRLAIAWMRDHGGRYDRVRVDAVGIVRDGTGGYTVTHAQEVG